MRKVVYTHAGMFHADEILAVATIKFFTSYELEIVRGYEPTGEEDYILDVGKKYDGIRWFDHHQDPALESTNMLVLDKFCIHQPELKERLKDRLYQEVSNVDRGLIEPSPTSFNSLIRGLNGVLQFEEVVDIAYHLLCGVIHSSLQSIKTEEIWENLERVGNLKIQRDTNPLVDWKQLAERDGIKGLITPSNRGGFNLISYDSNKWSIPSDELQTFRHTSGFMACYKTMEDIIRINSK